MFGKERDERQLKALQVILCQMAVNRSAQRNWSSQHFVGARHDSHCPVVR